MSPLDEFKPQLILLARQAEASVVNVVAQGKMPLPRRPEGRELKFFGKKEPPHKRIGSGIVIDADGSVITTASVVDGASAITVRTRSGDSLVATLKGIDRRTNMALLSVPGTLPRANLGESTLVTPGSQVVVVGSIPQGSPISSFGTVVADKGLVFGYSEVEMLELSAPMIRGTSGAAVMSADGRVVGMVCGTLEDRAAQRRRPLDSGPSGYIYGDRVISAPTSVAFAIPIERAREIAAELAERGRVERGFLGVIVQRTVASGREAPGVLVQDVIPGGPAARAGIRPGDKILAFEGGDLFTSDDLTFLVSATEPGCLVALKYARGGLTSTARTVIGLAPNVYPSSPRRPEESGGVYLWDGMIDKSTEAPGAPVSGSLESKRARRP